MAQDQNLRIGFNADNFIPTFALWCGKGWSAGRKIIKVGQKIDPITANKVG